MNIISIERTEEVLSEAKDTTIAVVGDVMLDRFFWGGVSRISPEAPVPVVDLEEESYRLGGAANVANNLTNLGINAVLFGAVGEDESGLKFRRIAEESSIDPSGVIIDKSRPTTVKTRIIGDNQHMVRLDKENRAPIEQKVQEEIVGLLKRHNNLSGVVFVDYDKGAITDYLILYIIEHCRDKEIPVYVDPKFNNFFNYKNVDFFKPNKKEAAAALRMEIKSEDDLFKAGKRLLELLKAKNVLITLGSEGMTLFEASGETTAVPTIARRISDVSGAGDTSMAVISAAIAGKATPYEAAALSNYASGAVCEMPGVVPITEEILLNTIKKSKTLSLNRKNVKK